MKGIQKKGFTIVELLGIIIVLGIILSITVPTIGNIASNSYMKAYEINLKSMEDGAKSYILKRNVKMNPGIAVQIQVSDLIDEALIDPIIDPKTKETCEGYVNVIDYVDSFVFSPCLKCGTNYVSEDCGKTDFVVPVITLLGENPINMYVGENYVDAGATALDDINGDITDKIQVSGYINPDKPGVYTLNYDVSDSEGNKAITVTRTINVIDNIEPIIIFNPNGNSTHAKSRSVVVNVRDINSGIKTSSLKYLWNTSTSAPNKSSFTTTFTNGGTINSPSGVTGDYYLWVYAEDNSGNSKIERTKVFKLDNTPPAVPTITATPTTLTNGNVTVSVSYPTDASIKKVSVNNGTTWSDYTGTLVVTSNTTLLVYAVDSSGNQSSTAKYTISNIDKTNPVIATSLKSIQKADFSTWSLGGGAYINESGALVLPTTGSSVATSPYIPVIGTPWELKLNGITSSVSPSSSPHGGVYIGSSYFDSSYTSAMADNNYTGNGYAPALPLNTLTAISWDGWEGYGSNVYYVRINVKSDGHFGVAPITLSDFKFITSAKSNYGKIIYVAPTDASGIKVTKWLAGSKTVNDFASSGNIVNSSFEVTSNGTYTVYTEDKAGNKAVKQVVINDIDASSPTVTFAPNGNSTYAKSRSTTVTVSDNVGLNTNNLKYMWNTSTFAPSPSAFTTTFTNGGTISSPSGVTGDYYLWILAQDTAGNTTIQRSNVFKLDNNKPVITITGNSVVNVTGGTSYSDAGATASDPHSGINGSVTSTGTVNVNVLGTYTITYNVSDKAGNTATATRTVKVIDDKPPTIVSATVPTTWTSGNKTITVTSSDTGLSGIAGYYISTSSTKPTSSSSWTASTSTTWTVSKGAGTYYIWVKDNAGNISSTYKSVTVTNIDGNAPTITAKGSSYTITEGDSNTISSTYFNINANGSAPISSTTCIDMSKNNAVVTNTSTLAVGTHVIKCTVTKATGLSANAQTTIVVNPAYTCSVGTLTNDPSKGWICVTNASQSSSSECVRYDSTGHTVYEDTYLSCGDSSSSWSNPGSFVYITCSKTEWTESCGNNSYTCYHKVSTIACLDERTNYSYYCPSGWSNYSGSGSSLKCYRAANQ